MNVNAGHERTSKARIIHQIQLIRGITKNTCSTNWKHHPDFIYFFSIKLSLFWFLIETYYASIRISFRCNMIEIYAAICVM
ncbi:hypothetical protein [Shigella dysenteriae]|uniref:hypothetical protein n=1 Tax=Shigella dysenteriae TaxID=622 RepID=UPI0014939224|nr:hypothetical protein [Shigella dysenteriae]